MNPNVKLATATLVLALGLNACSIGNHERTNSAPLQKQVRALAQVWSTGAVDQIDVIFAEDGVYEDVADKSVYSGREEIKAALREALTWAPDTRVEVISVIVSGNRGCVEWIWSGTQVGDIPDLMPATGRPFSVRGVWVLDFEDGKIKHNSEYYNAGRLLYQLGVGFDFSVAASDRARKPHE